MSISGWIECALFVGILFLLTKPVGLYMVQVLDPKRTTFLKPVLAPVEGFFYRVLGIDMQNEQNWREYGFSLMLFSFTGFLFTYAILRLQHLLPLNPQRYQAMAPDLAFNTAVSFVTNTNWQNYAGEATLSYFSQMVGLTLQNFISAASGIAVAAVLTRGIARTGAKTLGNFWVDLIRIHLYLLLPLSLVMALFLVSQGVIHNFRPYVKATPFEQAVYTTSDGRDTASTPAIIQGGAAGNARKMPFTIPQGPLASQEAIKMIGTNGGGFMGANSSHPFENPSPLTNFMQILAILLIPSAMTYYFGVMVGNRRHGWAVWIAMMILLMTGVVLCWWAESTGNPHFSAMGIDTAGGNMEGKEVRFGIFSSSLFATVTTAVSCGAVNAMHDSFTPLGGLVTLVNIQLGEVIFGGVGAGLYGMVVFIVLAVFLAGLMVGRTPEYMGKKIESYDVKVSALTIMTPLFIILGFAAWAAAGRWGLLALNNGGPHGLSEILYAFTSAAGNNGSAFAGLSANTQWYNVTLGCAMLMGRFFVIVPVMALAGNLAAKRITPVSGGSFPVTGPLFITLLCGTVLIVGALTFLPVLALGPIVEHFLMTSQKVLYW